ncbi:hypothetical protein N9W79_00045 [bacterium]|nr:hypothetical protein [bacterium]
MFGKFLKKGLLDKQKPRKRKKKFSKVKKSMLYGTSFLCCVFICFLLYLRVEPTLKNYTSLHSTEKTEWKVTIAPKNYSLLTALHRSIIDAQIKRHLLTGSRDELQSLSNGILINTEFDRVNVRRVHKDQIEIGVEIPEPVALIEADKLRFVSRNGAVFGKKNKDEKTGFVTIKGLFKTYKGKYKLSKTNKLILNEKLDGYIETSLGLIRLASEMRIPLKSILHNDYRGLAVKLDGDVFVSLGHGPYNKKLERLGTIIEKASQRGEKLSRIELDFAGKAFIQKKLDKQEM